MKKFKKLFGMFTALLVILGGVNLISCSDSDDDENEPEYSISVADSDKEISLAPGGSQTISVTTNGKMVTPTSSDSNVATATLDNSKKTITITAASGITETKTADITVKLNEDNSKSVTIKVTVNPEATENPDENNEEKTYSLALTLDETVAAKASKIKVYYGADNGTYDTVEAAYTAGETSATATLKLSLANSSGWFNGIKVTVYDSDGNTVATEIDTAYFNSSETGVTIKITAYVEQTMTLKFTFSENLGAKSVKIHYYPSDIKDADLTDSDGKTESAEVADNEATFTLSKSYASTWGFNTIVYVYDSNGDDITSNADDVAVPGSGAGSENVTISEATVRKIYFAFSADAEETVSFTKEDENQTYSFPYTSGTITVETEGYTKVLPASAFEKLTIKQLFVTVSTTTESATWGNVGAASSWNDKLFQSFSYGTKSTITSTDFIDALQNNGLYIQTPAGDFTVTVDYSEEEAETTTALITSLTEDTGSASYTATGKDTYQLLVAYDTIKDYTSVTITATNAAKGSDDESASLYFMLGTASGTYKASLSGSDTTYSATITPSDYSSAGVWIASDENNTATITVTGSTETVATQTTTVSAESVTVASSWSYSTVAIEASKFADLSITQLAITVTPSSTENAWTTGSDDKFGAGYSSAWGCDLTKADGATAYTGTITDSDVISGIKTNGLGFGGNSYGTASVEVVITYTTSSTTE